MTSTAAPETVHIHPLHGRNFTRHQTFEEWLAAWQAATSQEVAMGLLHSLYGAEFKINEEAILFLLDMADGFAQDCVLVTREERFKLDGRLADIDRLTASRARFAQKAFAVLCSEFFKPETARIDCMHERNYDYTHMVQNPVVREKVLRFFRSREDASERPLFNFPRSKGSLKGAKDPNLQAVEAFLKALVGYAWPNNGRGPSKLGEELRPRLIDILSALDRLDILLYHQAAEPAVPIRKALTSLALSCVSSGPRTVRQALIYGSRAAEILVILDARK
jgi:hypothetical protein